MPLVVAGIGVAGTLTAGIAGALVTWRLSNQREDKAWARERDREHEQRAREDEARTFEHRREAYLEFYVEVKALARTAYNHSYGFTEAELSADWHEEAAAKLRRLEFYADRELAAAASKAYGAAWSWGVYGKYDDPECADFHERQEKYDEAELVVLMLMRNRLAISEGDMELPPPSYSYESPV